LKILITYFSNTGNTEKVANSIKEGLFGEEINLLQIKDVDPSNLISYDLVILGSGIYASRVDKSVLNLVKNAAEFPLKFAYFCTHASLEFYQKPFYRVSKILAANGCKIVGEFDCVGDNLGIPLEKRLEMINQLPKEQRERAKEDMQKIKGRPNQQDLENARKFGESLKTNS